MTEQSLNETPLESWKEIAAYLQRDERTARRWEKDEGLPVHRHHHFSRASVYAYPSELEAWRAGRKPETGRTDWWRPVPAFASTITIALALMMAGSGPRVGAVVQAADGIVTRQVWAGPGVDPLGSPSPDGRFLTFTDWNTGDLAVRDLGTSEDRHLTSEASYPATFALYSVVSPDGKEVAYSWCNKDGFYELRTIGLDGSQVRVLYRNEKTPYIEPHDWSRDGKYILVLLSSQIATIAVTDGSVRILKPLDPVALVAYERSMWFSPKGRYIAYDYPSEKDSGSRDIFLLAADGSRERRLVQHPSNDLLLGWTPDGSRVLFGSDRTANWGAYLISVADGRPEGPAELIKRDLGVISPMGLTPDGSLFYSVGGWNHNVYTATLDVAGGKVIDPPVLAVERFLGENSNPDWSPDGRYLAYVSRRNLPTGKTRVFVLCIRNVSTGEERVLTPALVRFRDVNWSPDGRSILLSGWDNNGQRGLYRVDPRDGNTVPILEAEHVSVPWWSPDGKTVFYQKQTQVLARDLETGEDRVLYETQTHLGQMAPTPDGRRLAFTEGPSYTGQSLKLMSIAGGEPRDLLKARKQEHIRPIAWTPDGRYLLFGRVDDRRRTTELYRVPAQGGEAVGLGSLTKRILFMRFHPGGREIAFSAAEYKAEIWVMENFLPGSSETR